MDWPLAIERNRSALLRIVAELIVLAGVLTAGRIPRNLHRAILIVLRPAESAVRRLIIVAAHGFPREAIPPRRGGGERMRAGGGLVSAPANPPSPQPATSPRPGRIATAPRFQLFDTRKRFVFNRPRRMKPGTGPRITFFPIDDDPRVPLFRPPAPQSITIAWSPPREPSETVAAHALFRRLAAIKAALEDIPSQVQRLLRWQARRAAMKEAKFRDPLRPGRPPGHRTRRVHEIDDILKECGSLVLERARIDTS